MCNQAIQCQLSPWLLVIDCRILITKGSPGCTGTSWYTHNSRTCLVVTWLVDEMIKFIVIDVRLWLSWDLAAEAIKHSDSGLMKVEKLSSLTSFIQHSHFLAWHFHTLHSFLACSTFGIAWKFLILFPTHENKGLVLVCRWCTQHPSWNTSGKRGLWLTALLMGQPFHLILLWCCDPNKFLLKTPQPW